MPIEFQLPPSVQPRFPNLVSVCVCATQGFIDLKQKLLSVETFKCKYFKATGSHDSSDSG